MQLKFGTARSGAAGGPLRSAFGGGGGSTAAAARRPGEGGGLAFQFLGADFHPAVRRAQVLREGRHGRHGRRKFRRTSGAAADVAAPRRRGRATIVARRCARRTHSRRRHRGRTPAPAQTSAPDGCNGAGNPAGPRRAPLLACPLSLPKVAAPAAPSTLAPLRGYRQREAQGLLVLATMPPPRHGTSRAGAGGRPACRRGGRPPMQCSLSDVTGRQARPCCGPPAADCGKIRGGV